MFQAEPGYCDGQPSLKLVGELTIYTVTEARGTIVPRLSGHPSLVLDLSGIQEIDAAGVQLLGWLQRESGRNSGRLVLSDLSTEVAEVFGLLGIAGDFGCAAPSSPPQA